MSKEEIEAVIVLITVICILFVIINYFSKRTRRKNELEKENEELKKILYRNKDYKAKGIEEYQGSEVDRINRIANRLSLRDQQELLRYAERLDRNREE